MSLHMSKCHIFGNLMHLLKLIFILTYVSTVTVLLDFSLTVKEAPHERVMRTCQP